MLDLGGNLLTDPKEQYDIFEFGGDEGEDDMWAVPAVMKRMADHKRSLAKEPPIPLGTLDPYVWRRWRDALHSCVGEYGQGQRHGC